MDFIVTSETQPQLAAKLVDAGILSFVEGSLLATEGILFSYIGESNNKFHAFVSINEAIVKNSATIFDRIQVDINKPGAPLRALVGAMPPNVIYAMPDWAFRKALEALGLTAAWDTAISAVVTKQSSKNVVIWWERAVQISTLEQEWEDIAAEMVWKTSSEAELISTAKTIYGG